MLRLLDYPASANCYKVRLLLHHAQVAGEGGLDLGGYPGVRSWLARVERVPRMMNDLQPYPENARAGRGRSVHG